MPAFVIVLAIIAVIGAGILMFDSPGDAAPTGDQQAQAMPVETVVIRPETVQIWKQFSGHVVAVDQAEVRPQADGRITEVLFEDGQHVDAGDILMVIDPRPYQAALAEAEANLRKAKTDQMLANKEFDRARQLVKSSDISKSLYDNRVNAQQTANAAVKAAEAMVENATINLNYAYVRSPISGKVSRAEITVGNLVRSGPNAPLLTSVVAEDRVYVDFEVDEQTYLKTVHHMKKQPGSAIDVKLNPTEGLEYTGTVDSFDNRIDAASGTIRARAIFDNEDSILLPGMSVSVMMGSAGNRPHVLLTERAIGTDQDRKFVYVIDDGKTAYREVKIGDSVGGKRIVISGLETGDTVISEGIVRLRPGMPVTPKNAQQAAANAPTTLQD